jgi:hypothetical protein
VAGSVQVGFLNEGRDNLEKNYILSDIRHRIYLTS